MGVVPFTPYTGSKFYSVNDYAYPHAARVVPIYIQKLKLISCCS